MKPETKYLDKTEACHEVEYALRKDLHYRIGEILKLEHINAKHCREIERLNKDKGKCKICGNESPHIINDVCINCLKDKWAGVIEISPMATPELFDILQKSAGNPNDLFHHLKALIVVLSRKEGNAPINPDDIDVKYIEAASRYCYPVLFDKYAVLDQDDTTKLKIQFAEYILRMFGLENMYEYENLHTRGEIELEFIDHRSDEDENAEDDKHKIELADSILNKFGIETMAKYEELIQRGDIDIDILDHRVPHPPKGL